MELNSVVGLLHRALTAIVLVGGGAGGSSLPGHQRLVSQVVLPQFGARAQLGFSIKHWAVEISFF